MAAEPNDAGAAIGRRRARLAASKLTLVCPARRADGGRPDSVVSAALQGGVDVVQLRDPSAGAAEFATTAMRVRRICDAHGALFTVADRTEAALATAADGVHFGQPSADARDLRERVGGDLLIGLSPMSRDQVDAASGFDYIFVGPIFATPTKPGVEPVGVDRVAWATQRIRVPWFAVGGLTEGNIRAVVDAGAERVAAVRAIFDADDPSEAARSLLRALGEAPSGSRFPTDIAADVGSMGRAAGAPCAERRGRGSRS